MFNGILPIYKPKGMTSHDVVFKLRKILHMKKIGHTGTLDPDVDGLLVICLGQATKLVEFIMEGKKVYRGEITLGFSTETEDATGEIVEQQSVINPVPSTEIDLAMKSFAGEIVQIPPYYSAVKVNGRKLYEYARDKIEIERPTRSVTIYSFKRISEPIYNEQTHTQSWKFDVTCGKGTYVRTLAVDLGTKLGYPAHMSELTRLATGGYTLDQAITLEQIQTYVEDDSLEQYIQPIESITNQFPTITITQDQYQIIKHGQVVVPDYFGREITESTALIFEGQLIAIYYPHPTKTGRIKPQKMFV